MLRRRDDIMRRGIFCTDCEGAGFHYWPVYAKCETCDGTGKLSRDPPGWSFDAISGLWFGGMVAGAGFAFNNPIISP